MSSYPALPGCTGSQSSALSCVLDTLLVMTIMRPMRDASSSALGGQLLHKTTREASFPVCRSRQIPRIRTPQPPPQDTFLEYLRDRNARIERAISGSPLALSVRTVNNPGSFRDENRNRTPGNRFQAPKNSPATKNGMEIEKKPDRAGEFLRK